MNRISIRLTRVIQGWGILLFAVLLNACAGRQPAPDLIKNADDPLKPNLRCHRHYPH
jgi:hypothetical protein